MLRGVYPERGMKGILREVYPEPLRCAQGRSQRNGERAQNDNVRQFFISLLGIQTRAQLSSDFPSDLARPSQVARRQ